MSKTSKLTSKQEPPRKTFPAVVYLVEKGGGGWSVIEVIREPDKPRSRRTIAVYGNEPEAEAAAFAMYEMSERE